MMIDEIEEWLERLQNMSGDNKEDVAIYLNGCVHGGLFTLEDAEQIIDLWVANND